jgi:ATP-dependent Clp protease ATP-binding subunit ClpA
MCREPSTTQASPTRRRYRRTTSREIGARPLKRAIQDKLLNPLAQRLLAGDFKPGDTVKVSAGREEELEISKG